MKKTRRTKCAKSKRYETTLFWKNAQRHCREGWNDYGVAKRPETFAHGAKTVTTNSIPHQPCAIGKIKSS
jgi:hypothetical protein